MSEESSSFNEKSLEILRAILCDPDRFQKYSKQKFLQVNANELVRRKQMTHEAARRHARLNRYYNIVPYDHNRIKLTDTRFGSSDDYINASYIVAPYSIPRHYIATQGPLETTLYDFWRMVVEKRVPVIVCLTPLSENGIEKCARYWPLSNETFELSNNKAILKITHCKREFKDAEANTLVRSLALEFYDSSTQELILKHSVTQLQYLGWPDHGVPHETDSVVSLILLARQFYEGILPILVHCSAGCGRTGTFCVIDSAEEWLHHEETVLIDPIYALTDEFRKQRTTMVQAQAQYDFCYIALADFVDDDEEELLQ